VAEIVALHKQWREVDRSHRKLAYRGSYLNRVSASYEPNNIWIYDGTHCPAARSVAFAMEDVVSRNWITTVASTEETSTQVEVLFVVAVQAEGLWERVEGERQHRPLRRRRLPPHPPSPTTARR
jgi:putative transposase